MASNPQPDVPAIVGEFGHVWDEIVFDGTVFPPGGAQLLDTHGKVEVDTAKIGRDLGEHKASGRDGARTVDKGLKPGEVKITLTVWDAEGFAAARDLTRVFEARKRLRDRRPIRVYHPSLAQIGVDTIYAWELNALKPTGGGAAAMSISFKEFTPPAKRRAGVTRTVTPAAAIPNGVYDPFANTANQTLTSGGSSTLTSTPAGQLFTPASPSLTSTGP